MSNHDDLNDDLTFDDAPKAVDTLPSTGEHYGIVAEMINFGKQEEEYQGKRRTVHKLAFPIQVEEMLEPPEDADYEPRRKTIWLWTNLAFGDRAKFPKIYNKIMGREAKSTDRPSDIVGRTVRIDVVTSASGKKKIDHITGVKREFSLEGYKTYAEIQQEKAARETTSFSDEDRQAMAADDDIPF